MASQLTNSPAALTFNGVTDKKVQFNTDLFKHRHEYCIQKLKLNEMLNEIKGEIKMGKL
jgi:hypothetical protein